METSNIKIWLDKTLGRQMFQIAAGYAYALDHNIELYVDFDVAYYLRPILEACPIIKHKSQDLELFKPLGDGAPIKEGSELFIQGSFQDLKYFDHRKEEIKQLFSSLVAPKQEKTLGIHIRAGELMSDANKVPHVDETYINGILETVNPEEVDSIVVYSDDNYLANQYISGALKANDKWTEKPYKISCDFNTLNVFKALTSSSILAISNSSLSWWAAYLGTYEKVLTPDLYILGDPYLSLSLLEWEAIESDIKKPRVAIITTAYGSYIDYFAGLYESCLLNLFPTAEKHFFIFTDATYVPYSKNTKNITVIPHKIKDVFKDIECKRFYYIHDYKHLYKNYTHILLCNIEMRVNSIVDFKTIIPQNNCITIPMQGGGSTYHWSTTYKQASLHLKSNPLHVNTHYIAGATKYMLNLISDVVQQIDTDTASGDASDVHMGDYLLSYIHKTNSNIYYISEEYNGLVKQYMANKPPIGFIHAHHALYSNCPGTSKYNSLS